MSKLKETADNVTVDTPSVTSPATSVKLHLDAYEARHGLAHEYVRPGMFSLHGTEMHTKEEWEQMFEAEMNRTIV